MCCKSGLAIIPLTNCCGKSLTNMKFAELTSPLTMLAYLIGVTGILQVSVIWHLSRQILAAKPFKLLPKVYMHNKTYPLQALPHRHQHPLWQRPWNNLASLAVRMLPAKCFLPSLGGFPIEMSSFTFEMLLSCRANGMRKSAEALFSVSGLYQISSLLYPQKCKQDCHESMCWISSLIKVRYHLLHFMTMLSVNKCTILHHRDMSVISQLLNCNFDLW